MKNFRKNVFRLAMKNRGSLIGATLIIGLGILVFVGMISSAVCLENNKTEFFEQAHLADVYAELTGISESQIGALEDAEGIRSVDGRLSADVRVNRKDVDKTVSLNVSAYNPDARTDLMFLSGEAPKGDQIYIGKHMQKVYNYEIGDTIELVYNDTAKRFTYAGTAQTPSMMEPSLSVGGYVDGSAYDIAVVSREGMASLTGMEGFYTSLGIVLDNGYDYRSMEQTINSLLTPYGLISMTGQEKQSSIISINDSIGMILSVGYSMPVIFLAVAVFMLYVIIKKIVDRDRTLIGAMKAFGLTDAEMITSYLAQGALLGSAGALIGVALGWPVGQYMFDDTALYYGFPNMNYFIPWWVAVLAFAIAIITGIIASYLSVKSILKITPSDAMRPPAPKSVNEIEVPKFIEKETGIMGILAVRATTQYPLNGFLIVFAIAFSIGISSAMISVPSAVDESISNYFDSMAVYDLQVSLTEKAGIKSLEDAAMKIDHIQDAEVSAVYSVTMYNGGLRKYTGLSAVQEDSRLFRLLDYEKKSYDLHNGGIVLDERSAEYLMAETGDEIEILIPEISNTRYKVFVSDIITQSIGDSSYIGIHALGRITGLPEKANSLMIKVDEGYETEVIKSLQNAGNVMSVSITENDAAKQYNDTGSVKNTAYAIAIFGILAGVIMVYNISMINFRERITELGTMLILGRSERDIGQMLFVEQMMYFALGSVFGLLSSGAFKAFTELLVNSDFMMIAVHMGLKTYAIVIAICLAMVCLSCFRQYRAVQQIQLTDILKERC